MTQEEKQLLLIDLCARLPYGVKVWYKYYPINITEKFATSIKLSDNKIALSSKFTKEGSWHAIEEAGEILIKPYLRPMSSMTEEEKALMATICLRNAIGNVEGVVSELSDFYNSRHFDFRGLIPIGLALEAKEGMYD